eukprot:1175755-Prorocentrum_minimum.AAC.2
MSTQRVTNQTETSKHKRLSLQVCIYSEQAAAGGALAPPDEPLPPAPSVRLTAPRRAFRASRHTTR